MSRLLGDNDEIAGRACLELHNPLLEVDDLVKDRRDVVVFPVWHGHRDVPLCAGRLEVTNELCKFWRHFRAGLRDCCNAAC